MIKACFFFNSICVEEISIPTCSVLTHNNANHAPLKGYNSNCSTENLDLEQLWKDARKVFGQNHFTPFIKN